MVKLMQETFKFEVTIFAWSKSIDGQIDRLAAHTNYLDIIFDSISVPGRNAQLTNADKLNNEPMLMNFKYKDDIIDAATHKYPDAHDYDNCLRFAEVLMTALMQ